MCVSGSLTEAVRSNSVVVCGKVMTFAFSASLIALDTLLLWMQVNMPDHQNQ